MTEREWHEAKDMRPSFVGLGVVLLVAAILRLWAIGHGIPYAPGVDEPEIMCRVVGMMKTGDFNPHFFDYPGLYLYTQLVVAVVRFLAGAMSGRWVSLSQVGPADFYLWGRVATATLGTITVYLVYQIGMRWGARHRHVDGATAGPSPCGNAGAVQGNARQRRNASMDNRLSSVFI